MKNSETPARHILFLGYNATQTRLIDVLLNHQCDVSHCAAPLTVDKIKNKNYDLIISFGYQHILHADVIDVAAVPIINLHMAYLPWNRGAHPNFWSFYDDTPSGVTIHLIDSGVDTGKIVYQQLVMFEAHETTFRATYRRLIHELESLFEIHIDSLLNKNFTPTPQKSTGTYHCVADLPEDFQGWDCDIKTEIHRLRDTKN